ncbi:MAG TPA: FtsX-like permease family protein [Candidatus Binatia bacterium]|jgi:putative ABC transport system permease protein|nr:FtsX-like permease family protein [Candidatus Binatia bacterium]
MTTRTLVFRSLRFYWRGHLGVLAGTCVSCAILTGALVVGDSERYTLEQMGRARLGKTEMALKTEEHFVRARLADELERDLKATVAPAIMLRGSAALPDGRARANDVQIVGVEERFWKLGGTSNLLQNAESDELVVNERLAKHLGVGLNDTLILRVERPSLISREAPLSGRSDVSIPLRGRVRAMAGEGAFGRFSLQANQVAQMSVFVPLRALQEQLKHTNQANLLLTSAGTNANPALRADWALADTGLEVRELPGSKQIELRTDRVFLEPEVARSALTLSPVAVGALTYFVNEFRLGQRTTPYSFITAAGHQQRDDEITINSWLAEDLRAKVGDELALRYFVIGERRELAEQTATFRVHEITPLEPDSSWMPDFPGLADVGNCRDWEPGTPIDTGRIRPKDEDYWKKYRGTPKAFVTLAAGQRLWSNRFGNLTAVRYPAGTPVESKLRQTLEPGALGLFFTPVRELGLQASRQSLDFGQLFIGFSFFLIVAALLLTGMLYAFNVEQRHEEAGLLRALGFRPRQVQRILLSEGGSLAILGTVIGVATGVLYTKLALYGLSTVWQKAVGTSEFRYHAEPATVLLGAGLSLAAAVGAMWLAQRGQARRAPAELLGSGADANETPSSKHQAPGKHQTPNTKHQTRKPGRHWVLDVGVWCFSGVWGLVFGVSLAGAVVLVVCAGREKDPETFFSVGALLLLAGIAFSQRLLAAMTRLARSLGAMGRRNAARRRGRSLTSISVLASGVFLVVAVNAFRQNPQQEAQHRRSGTGGFALYARSALPVYDDLNSAAGRELFGLPSELMKDVSAVPLRVREGDDASCLNLNRAVRPRLVGLRAEELERRKAFTFVSQAGNWGLLNQLAPDGAVPAVGDEQTVRWSLGKKVGDTLPYTDERGKTFTIRIVGIVANSILQGSLLISEQHFVERFPDTGGYRAFLIDARRDCTAEVAEALSRGLQDRGLEVTPAWRRLADFLEVENTYLAIFQALGGLGLWLGSVGLGIVVLRNVLERRGELALLQAVGFRRRALQWLVLSEHWLLIFLGLASGLVAAVLALWPALRSPGTEVPVVWLTLTLAGLALGGMLWSWLAALAALHGPLLPALRNE